MYFIERGFNSASTSSRYFAVGLERWTIMLSRPFVPLSGSRLLSSLTLATSESLSSLALRPP
jgi:hypothetical protein